MRQKFYTGIGSRETPEDTLLLMTRIARSLARKGWTLRSGHAVGADRAFEIGAQGQAVIYLPWNNFGQIPFNDDPGVPVLGAPFVLSLQEAWENYCDLIELGIRQSVRPKDSIISLHGRNVLQITGHEGQPNSQFVICWCPEENCEPVGGTATAVKLARHLGIPCFNLLHDEQLERLRLFVQEKDTEP